MKTLSIALVLGSALTSLGLAGCQTVDDDGYYDSSYSAVVYRDRYVYDTPRYRSPPPRYVERPPAPAWNPGHRPPPPPQWQPRREQSRPVYQPRPQQFAPPPNQARPNIQPSPYRRWQDPDDPSRVR